jgi:hypothetical protein
MGAAKDSHIIRFVNRNLRRRKNFTPWLVGGSKGQQKKNSNEREKKSENMSNEH